jgi:hypothetical protein
MEELYDDALTSIFFFLDAKTSLIAEQVSKRWKTLLRNNLKKRNELCKCFQHGKWNTHRYCCLIERITFKDGIFRSRIVFGSLNIIYEPIQEKVKVGIAKTLCGRMAEPEFLKKELKTKSIKEKQLDDIRKQQRFQRHQKSKMKNKRY